MGLKLEHLVKGTRLRGIVPGAAVELIEVTWYGSNALEVCFDFAVRGLVPEHLNEVKAQRADSLTKTLAAVKERLTQAITFWDNRAQQLREQERVGKPNARIGLRGYQHQF